jgi:hypothetical protein
MAMPTRAPTAQDIIDADDERVMQAKWAALCELSSEYDKVVDMRTFDRWCRRVNCLARSKMKLLN